MNDETSILSALGDLTLLWLGLKQSTPTFYLLSSYIANDGIIMSVVSAFYTYHLSISPLALLYSYINGTELWADNAWWRRIYSYIPIYIRPYADVARNCLPPAPACPMGVNWERSSSAILWHITSYSRAHMLWYGKFAWYLALWEGNIQVTIELP